MPKNTKLNAIDLQIIEIDSDKIKFRVPSVSAEEIFKKGNFDGKPSGSLSRIENKQMLLKKYNRVEMVENFNNLNREFIKKNFGNNLIKLREQLGFTASDMAEIFGCSKMNYGNWEHRGNLPKYDDLIKILRFYEITPEEIMLTEIDCEKVLERLLTISNL